MKSHAYLATTHTFGRRGDRLEHGKRNTRRHRQTRAIKNKHNRRIWNLPYLTTVRVKNHIMDWNSARVIRAESNKYQRWIGEAIEIRTGAWTGTRGRTPCHTWKRPQIIGGVMSPYCLENIRRRVSSLYDMTLPIMCFVSWGKLSDVVDSSWGIILSLLPVF